jgi:signal transduction histidine kinase
MAGLLPDNYLVETFQWRLLRFPVVKRQIVVAAFSVLGLVLIGLVVMRLFGVGRTLQLVLTLLVPAAVMVVFWKAARERIGLREDELQVRLETERASYRATNEFLESVSHELRLHPEPCSLLAESLAVAVDYRAAREHLKVAVPDLVIKADPYALRQILHSLVSNAIRHGGERVAVWAVATGTEVEVSVSDDGPGVAKILGDHLFERIVDLGGSALGSPGVGTGLSIARELAHLMGGEMTYRRDSKWSHFSVRLPIGIESHEQEPAKVELEAQVG